MERKKIHKIELIFTGIGFWLFLSNFGLLSDDIDGWNRYSRISKMFQDLSVYNFRSELMLNLLFIVSIVCIVTLLWFTKLNKLNRSQRNHIKIVATIFSLVMLVGNIAENSDYIFGGPFRLLLCIASILKWYSLFVVTVHALSLLYWFLLSENHLSSHNVQTIAKKESEYWVYWVVIIIAWIPYIALNFPGVVTTDGFWQLRQAIGSTSITDHHPIFHTALLWVMHYLSHILGGTNTTTVFLYVICQSLILSSIYAFTVEWLRRRGINTWLLFSILGYYALAPIHSFNATVLSKDFLSGGFILLTSIWLYEFLEQEDRKPSGIRWRIGGVLALVIAGFLRNNTFYAVVGTVIIISFSLLFLKRKNKLKDLMTLIFVLVLLFSKGVLLQTLGIPSSPATESLSMPIQQIARTIVRTGEVPNEIRGDVDQLFTIEELENLYDPYISDPVKFTIAERGINTESILRMWKTLGIKHPWIYVDSLIFSNFGYWYPQLNFSSVLFPNAFDVYEQHEISVPLNGKGMYVSAFFAQAFQFIPLVNLLVGIGFMFFLGVLAFDLSCLTMNNRHLLLVFLPVFLAYGTILIAAPMAGSPRYAHFLFTTIPFLVTIPYLSRLSVNENMLQEQIDMSQVNDILGKRNRK